jgi:hypothetical protein
MTKLAHVYERNGEWYYQPSSKATTGLWIATPPQVQVSSRDSQQRKGEAALEVLNASQQGVPLPEDTGSVIAPLLTRAGVKSWPEFMKKAKGVGLELEGNQLTVTPHRQIPRSKGALEGIEDQHILLPADASPDEIGAALEEAMSRCQ